MSEHAIVVDLGCHPHGPHDSIGELIAKYQPTVLFGFDPHPDTAEGAYMRDGCMVIVTRAAAWIDDKGVDLDVDGWCTAVTDGHSVRSFDFAAWLLTLPSCAEIVVKMDVEGAEYALVPALQASGAASRINLLLLEEHLGTDFHVKVDDVAPAPLSIDCPVQEWWM